MSATAIETGSKTRGSSRRSRPHDKTDDQADGAGLLPEDAVADLMKGYVRTVAALLPTAAVRPTEAVDAVFDLAEQMLSLTRQTVREAVALMESGFEELDRAA